MCTNAMVIELKNKIKKASTLSIFIRIEIVYHSNSNQNEYQYVIFISYENGIMLLGISCRVILNFKKKLTFNFNLHHFCFSVLT